MESRWGLSGVFGLIALAITCTTGCSSTPDVIPETLEPQVDRSVSFPQLMASPDSYNGRMVVLGGEVLKARRLKEGTELEVLELPLDKYHRPALQRTESRGRFLALDRNLPDPAAFPPGVPVTIVGETSGSTTQQLDDVEQRYPVLDVKHAHVWTDDPNIRRGRWGPSVGVGVGIGSGGYGGGGFGFGGISIGTGF